MRVEETEDYSHSIRMALIDRSTELAAPADRVWVAVKMPSAFRTVTRGLLTMPAMRNRSEEWREGETVVGWVFLFGVVPFSRHHLHIARVDDSERTLSSQEHGGLLKTWSHDIVVTPIDDQRCSYRDRIDIDAGVFTPIVGVYARWFYAMRQRRWRALAGRLA